MNKKIYAVITGDIVNSSRLSLQARGKFLNELKRAFRITEEFLASSLISPFEIYRGDSFQCVISKPEIALKAVIILRSHIRHIFGIKERKNMIDARIAVGIGNIEFLKSKCAGEGDGEAFRLSGKALEGIKGDGRLLIRSAFKDFNEEIEMECALLDALINRWSKEQAEAMANVARGLTQEKMARILDISQPAVRQRLKSAGGWAVAKLFVRYERFIKKYFLG
ncbi:hypothetical protein OMAG_001117 [Candidatus Omnitrophus magneticus]|uniref:SatD family (SatD) n=1 Tax=Candidatus Omnitrophus magneticus TaxID=1609969 RepID=A0A0F0CU99_9BACT|nr:hypothetical protein OMAG_001117 [Candidatus Omnitrophus magneticus]